MTVPEAKAIDCEVQVVPQEIPAGDEVTVPADALLFVSVSTPPNVAPTLRAWVITTVQVERPVQAPVQPRKYPPEAMVAVSVTVVL
jgi:hypothetical protein